jgi:N6-adenosine-specific RNA methylase IME4
MMTAARTWTLPAVGAGAIMVDPAFRFATRSAKGQGRAPSRHYADMTIEEIAAVPVADMAADDAWLFLWIPAPHTPAIVPVMTAWGFSFSGLGFSWVKTTKLAVVTPTSVMAAKNAASPWHTGMGYTTRKNTELCWLGRRGNPKRVSKGVHELIVAPVREHSRKPAAVYERIERYCGGPYVELFARQHRPGWIVWGDQIGLFDGDAS